MFPITTYNACFRYLRSAVFATRQLTTLLLVMRWCYAMLHWGRRPEYSTGAVAIVARGSLINKGRGKGFALFRPAPIPARHFRSLRRLPPANPIPALARKYSRRFPYSFILERFLTSPMLSIVMDSALLRRHRGKVFFEVVFSSYEPTSR